MIAQVTCTNSECYADIEVDFEYEPEDAEVGYPAECAVSGVEGCDCEQDDDVLQEQLLEWLKNEAEVYDE